MTDAEDLAGDLAEARAQGHVEALEHGAAKRIGVVPRRQQQRGERARPRARIGAENLDAPGGGGASRRLGQTVVPGEDVAEALLLEHGDRLLEPEQQGGRRREGKEAALAGGDHRLPFPIRARQLGALAGVERLGGDGVEAEPRRQHQPLLRAGDGDVDAPFVVAEIGDGEGRDGIDQQQRRMLGAVERAAHRDDVAGDAGRGLRVHQHHRLDGMRPVRGEAGLGLFRVDRMAPIAGDELDDEAEALSQHAPQRGELAGLEGEHAVTRRERVHQGGFPGAGARGGEDRDRARRAEDPLHPGDNGDGERGEIGAAMIDHRLVDGAQDAVGHIARPGNLQKMPAAFRRHSSLLAGTGECARKSVPSQGWCCCRAAVGGAVADALGGARGGR